MWRADFSPTLLPPLVPAHRRLGPDHLFAPLCRYPERASMLERHKLAQELHDGVCQTLQVALLQGSILGSRLSDPEHRQELKEILHMICEGAQDLRAVSHEMIPSAERSAENLSAALQELAVRTNSVLSCEFRGESVEANPAVAFHLYRVAQEGINNALKHSGATEITITLQQSDDLITVCVEDNGNGYVSTSKQPDGVGLKSMQRRADGMCGLPQRCGNCPRPCGPAAPY